MHNDGSRAIRYFQRRGSPIRRPPRHSVPLVAIATATATGTEMMRDVVTAMQIT